MCEKLAGQRKCSLERKLSETWVFLSEESKQSLTLDSKGVKRFVLYTPFQVRIWVITLVIRLPLSPLGVGRAPVVEVYFLLLGERRRVKELFLVLLLFQVILVWNNQYVIGVYLEAACSGPQHWNTGRQATSKWFYLNRFPAMFSKMCHQEIQPNKILLCCKEHREQEIALFWAAYLISGFLK